MHELIEVRLPHCYLTSISDFLFLFYAHMHMQTDLCAGVCSSFNVCNPFNSVMCKTKVLVTQISHIMKLEKNNDSIIKSVTCFVPEPTSVLNESVK